MTLTALVLFFLSTPALADDYASAAVDPAQASEELGRLAAQALQAEARLHALEEARLKCLEGCKKPAKAPAPKPAAESAAPAPAPAAPPQQIEVTPIPAPAPVPVVDPELEQAKRELEAAKRAYDAAVAAMATMQPPKVENTFSPEITVKPADVVIVPKPTRLIGYVGGGAVFAGSVPDVSGPVVGRAVAGVRPSVKIPGAPNLQVAFTAEASYENLGMGARLSPELLIAGNSGEWGIGGGVAYACNSWQGNGCLAEYYGGMARGTWTPKNSVGPLVFVNAEFGGLSVSGMEDPASAFRLVTGAALRFGNPHARQVTVP